MFKTCPKCRESKRISQFHHETRDGWQSWCKACMKERAAQYYEENKQAVIERSKARQRALRRLRDAHRAEYDTYVQEELPK